jgi:hypothetical protein
MGDLFSKSRILNIKRHELAKMTALMNIHSRGIRIMELEEEIDRCKVDIAAQNKVIEEADTNINLQKQEMERESKEAAATKEDVVNG